LDEKDKKKVKRITFNEITKEAVEEALEHPRKIDMN
jgi:DNA topoisomerase-1